MKRLLSLVIALLLLSTAAMADWTCPQDQCGATLDDSMDYCPNCGADAPLHGLTVKVVGADFLQLQWQGYMYDSVDIFYREAGESAWRVGGSTTKKKFRLEGLESRTEYELMISDWDGREQTVTGTTAQKPVKVGDYITFGSYMQGSTGKMMTPIEWRVLQVEDNRAFVISRYGLDTRPYNNTSASVKWKNSPVRTWLNDEFYQTAFTEQERACILLTKVVNDESQSVASWGTDGGDVTQDYLFLLSYVQAWEYMTSDKDRLCRATNYAVSRGAAVNRDYSVDGSGSSAWWLRTPGSRYSNCAYVRTMGTLKDMDVTTSDTVIRPAMWINLDAGGV